MIEAMESIYCGSIGVEYMHIVDTKEKRWIQQRLESAVVNSITQMIKRKAS